MLQGKNLEFRKVFCSNMEQLDDTHGHKGALLLYSATSDRRVFFKKNDIFLQGPRESLRICTNSLSLCINIPRIIVLSFTNGGLKETNFESCS